MKKPIGFIGIITLVAVFFLLLMACGGGNLRGTYTDGTRTLEFLNNSKVIWTNNDFIVKKSECKYYVNGTLLRLTDSFGIVNDLTIKDNKIIIDDERGNVYRKR
jgi:hypothetical protein